MRFLRANLKADQRKSFNDILQHGLNLPERRAHEQNVIRKGHRREPEIIDDPAFPVLSPLPQ